jgi:leucyl-tRNA synthetase
MILGDVEFTGYRDSDEQWISADQVTENDEKKPILKSDGSPVQAVKLDPEQCEKSTAKNASTAFVLQSDPSIGVDSRAHKMSKSRGNVVNPDVIVAEYGADALRLYEMFMGPLEQSKPWSMSGVNGVRGFLDRAWRMIVDQESDEIALNPAIGDHPPTDKQLQVLHRTIKAVSQDIENLSFNTSISRLMEFVNFFTKENHRPKQIMEQFSLLLAPLAPHLSEELWRILGNEKTLAYESWPQFEEALTVDASVEIPIQIMGKIRSKIVVPRGTAKDELLTLAKADPKIAELIDGKNIIKEIAVPDRLVNIVAK